jgi:hypothetical protein
MIGIHTLLLSLFVGCGLTYAQQPAEEQKKRPAVELFETVIVNADFERPEIPGSPTTIAEVTSGGNPNPRTRLKEGKCSILDFGRI